MPKKPPKKPPKKKVKPPKKKKPSKPKKGTFSRPKKGNLQPASGVLVEGAPAVPQPASMPDGLSEKVGNWKPLPEEDSHLS